MEPPCSNCNAPAFWDMHYNGSASCMRCGALSQSQSFNFIHGYTPLNSLQQNVAYTRTKRFQKYLNHACMKQSIKSVPDETWKFLLDNKPYNSPGHIVHTLKRAKLKRKCYDCLPMFVLHLCDNCDVPTLTEREYNLALNYFRVVDQAFPNKGSFMSYLYVLEFILTHMGRTDMLPFISRIHCRKRREKYKRHLTSIITSALSDGSLQA